MNICKHEIACAASAVIVFTVLAIGCGRESADSNTTPKVTPVSASSPVDGSAYILAEEPDGATGVIAAREDAKDGDEIVLIGRIGGSKKPWIEGRAAFMVIDASMSVVGDGEESAKGELCLDDCCASLRAECTTLVKIVDTQGRVLSVDARELLNANVDDLVVIRGHVQRDAKEGAFVVIADGVHVRR
mgnify:CR=1 FL=1